MKIFFAGMLVVRCRSSRMPSTKPWSTAVTSTLTTAPVCVPSVNTAAWARTSLFSPPRWNSVPNYPSRGLSGVMLTVQPPTRPAPFDGMNVSLLGPLVAGPPSCLFNSYSVSEAYLFALPAPLPFTAIASISIRSSGKTSAGEATVALAGRWFVNVSFRTAA